MVIFIFSIICCWAWIIFSYSSFSFPPHSLSLFSTNKWVLEDKKEVIENLVDNGYNIIDEHYIEVGENLTEKQRERYKKFQFNYENDDTKLKKKLLKDVELTILNN